MKTFAKIIALVLCVLMIVPMLFACDKKEEAADETTANEGVGILPEIEIPNFKATANLVMTSGEDTMNITQEISHYDGNLHIDVAEGLLQMIAPHVDKIALTICDNVVYVQYGEYKYMLDLGDISPKALLTAFFADAPTETVNSAVTENDATFMSTTSGESDSLFFKEVTTGTDAKGNTVTTYSGIKAKIAQLINHGLASAGISMPVVIDYDSFSFAVSKTSDDKFAGATLGVTVKRPVGTDPVTYETVYNDIDVTAGIGFEYGEAAKVTAPEDAETYADVLPIVIQMASEYFESMISMNMDAFIGTAEAMGYTVEYMDENVMAEMEGYYGMRDAIRISNGESVLTICEFPSADGAENYAKSSLPLSLVGEVIERFYFAGDREIMNAILNG